MPKKRKKPQFIEQINQRWQRFVLLFPKVGKGIRWAWRIFLVVMLIDVGFLIGIWPEWKWYAGGDIPKSRFIYVYERETAQNPNLPRLRWKTIPYRDIPVHMLKAVLSAEDHRFFEHDGIDTDALQSAMEHNWERGRVVYGASTISQQTVKNLFLSGSRNPFRKIHEVMLTYSMERNLNKKRILEIYLNVAEFGRGIYGIESAAQRYWGISASQLSVSQAIELAATLPAPKKHNPRTRTKFFQKQTKKIRRNMGL